MLFKLVSASRNLEGRQRQQGLKGCVYIGITRPRAGSPPKQSPSALKRCDNDQALTEAVYVSSGSFHAKKIC